MRLSSAGEYALAMLYLASFVTGNTLLTYERIDRVVAGPRTTEPNRSRRDAGLSVVHVSRTDIESAPGTHRSHRRPDTRLLNHSRAPRTVLQRSWKLSA